MPCYKYNIECPKYEIKLKFAFRPVTDMNGNTIWLKRYWEYGSGFSLGFFVLRGLKRTYEDKLSFWDAVVSRISGIC